MSTKLNKAILKVAQQNPEFRRALKAELGRSMFRNAKGMKVPRIESYLAKIFKERLGVTDPRMAQFLWGMFLRAGEIATSPARGGAQEEAAQQSYTLWGTETSSESGRDGAEYVNDSETADVTFTSEVSVDFDPRRITGREIKVEFLRLARTLLRKNNLDENQVWGLWTKYVADDVASALDDAYEKHKVRETDDLEDLMEEFGEGEYDAYGEFHDGSRDGGNREMLNAYGSDVSSWYVSSADVTLNYEATSSGDLIQSGSCQVYGSPRFDPSWD
jgi:hypothetical protein